MSSKLVPTKSADRVSISQMVLYGLGAFTNNLLSAAYGGMMIVLNLGLGMNPALVGIIGAIPRLFDAFTDPLMGYVSDKTQSRWGRRRPYIFAGAIFAGLSFIVLWQLPIGQSETFYFWYFLCLTLVFFVGHTMFATPWVALGYELTPDYNERTRLMGVQNMIGQLPYFMAPWFLPFMLNQKFFGDMVEGAAGLSIIIGLSVIAIGILPALFLRERFSGKAEKNDEESRSFLKNATQQIGDFFIGLKQTLTVSPFLKLCFTTFLIFNGFMLIASFQSYVLIYYVCAGDTELGAKYGGYAGTVGAISTLGVIALSTWLGTKMGKRRALILTTSISLFGYALKWVCYDPTNPMLVILPAPFIAFGLGSLFTLIPSMIADVVDLDELSTKERREGMFGSIFWWITKLGMSAAILSSGYLLNATGFDVALEAAQSDQTLFLLRVFDVGIPVIASAIAIIAMISYDITPERAQEIRNKLEKMRGTSQLAS